MKEAFNQDKEKLTQLLQEDNKLPLETKRKLLEMISVMDNEEFSSFSKSLHELLKGADFEVKKVQLLSKLETSHKEFINEYEDHKYHV